MGSDPPSLPYDLPPLRRSCSACRFAGCPAGCYSFFAAAPATVPAIGVHHLTSIWCFGRPVAARLHGLHLNDDCEWTSNPLCTRRSGSRRWALGGHRLPVRTADMGKNVSSRRRRAHNDFSWARLALYATRWGRAHLFRTPAWDTLGGTLTPFNPRRSTGRAGSPPSTSCAVRNRCVVYC